MGQGSEIGIPEQFGLYDTENVVANADIVNNMERSRETQPYPSQSRLKAKQV